MGRTVTSDGMSQFKQKMFENKMKNRRQFQKGYLNKNQQKEVENERRLNYQITNYENIVRQTHVEPDKPITNIEIKNTPEPEEDTINKLKQLQPIQYEMHR